jgi:hypothetical protein
LYLTSSCLRRFSKRLISSYCVSESGQWSAFLLFSLPWHSLEGAALMLTPRMLVQRTVTTTALFAALVYAGDYLSVRIRMLRPKPADPFESLTAPRLLAIPEKGGKTSYEIDQQNPQQNIVCVHSLFPHFGYSTCWYLKTRIGQPIPMVIIPANFSYLSRHTLTRRDPWIGVARSEWQASDLSSHEIVYQEHHPVLRC